MMARYTASGSERAADDLRGLVEQDLPARVGGALERQRREVGEHLDDAQVLAREGRPRARAGQHEDAQGAPALAAHRARDERGAGVPRPRAAGALGAELVLEAGAQGAGAHPVLQRGDEERLALLDGRLGDAAAIGVVAAREDGLERGARRLVGEPGGGRRDHAAAPVDDLERAPGDVQQGPDPAEDLVQRLAHHGVGRHGALDAPRPHPWLSRLDHSAESGSPEIVAGRRARRYACRGPC
jgi:hypothetical protein